MNRNLMIVLAGGLLIAILVAMIVQASLGGKKKGEAKDEARAEIIVASKPLATGVRVDEKNVKWAQWPKSAVFSGAIVREGDEKPHEAAEGRLLRPVAEGEPITKNALIGEKAGNFLAAALADGKVATTIDVTAVKSVGGFVAPGDYVDVILSYKKRVDYSKLKNPQIDAMVALNIENRAAETILQNIRVLAVDQAPARDEEKGVKVGKTITLEVDRRQAEILAMARNIGDLVLTLRQLGDDKQYARDYEIVTDERLTNIADDIYNQVLKMQNSSSQQADIVRIYSGAMLSQVPVSGQ